VRRTGDLALPGALAQPARRGVRDAAGARLRALGSLLRAQPAELVCALAAVGLIGAVYATQVVRILVADRFWLITHMPDDAYYYLGIGQHAAHGQGLTFDGFTPTNGFHPLWEGLVTGLARITGGGDALVRAALVSEVVLALLGTVLLAVLVRRAVGSAAALLAVLVAVHFPSAMDDLSNGMESAVVVLCVGLVLLTLARSMRTARLRDGALLGAACGLLVLARLDFVLVAWMPLAVCAWRLRSPRAGLAGVAGAVAVSGPYFLWDRFTYGHWLTVSGTLKQDDLAHYVQAHFGGHLTLGWLQFFGGVLQGVGSVLWRVATFTAADGVAAMVVGNVLAVLCVVGLAMLLRRARRDGLGGERGAALLALGCGVVLLAAKTVVDAAFSPFWVASWYAAAQRIVLAMAVGALVWLATEPMRRRVRHGGVLVALLAGLVFLPLNLGGVSASRTTPVDGTLWPGADLEAVAWITAHGPSGRYGAPDAGVLGFYTAGSHASVSDLDGLAASYSYADALMQNRPPLQRYRMLGLDFLIARRTLDSPDVPSCAPVIWTSPQGVVYGGSLDSPTVTSVPLRIWDLRPCNGVQPA